MGGESARAEALGRAGPRDTGRAGGEGSSRRRARFLVVAVVALLASVIVGACGDKGSKVVSTTPTRTDVIEAVRQSVNGKTYVETVYKSVPTTRFCNEIDVDLDPYMPHNPELAKCPYVGKSYVVQDTVAADETRKCATLPAASDGSWYVEDRGDDSWRVSRNTSSWDVGKVGGGSASLPVISVSGFEFTIEADQDC